MRVARASIVLALLATSCTGEPSPAEPSIGGSPSPTVPASPSATSTPTPDGTRAAPLRVRTRIGLPPADPSLPVLTATEVAGAEYPSGLAVAPDGRIFYTELFDGEIKVIEPDGAVSTWFDVNAHFGIEWMAYNHAGLSGVTVDPDFDRNGFLYAITQIPNERTGVSDRSVLLRFQERGGRGSKPTVILEIPASRRYNMTYSVVFAPDGTMFVPAGSLEVGGRGVPGDLVGEILHVTRDGDPAPGGPFGAEAPSTWAHGIRNAFDVAIEPKTGYLVAGDNGNHGHDEIDLIAPGRYYGWPRHEGVGDVAGMTQPMVEIRDGHWAPTGIVRYEGRRFPELQGLFLLCMNHQPGVYALRVEPGPPARVVSFTKVGPSCSTDIATSRDGRIYVADASAVYELT